ncbi:hypothetical protein JST97_31160 [bacterium]|nr:hypothetical protein [bacterium]
MSAVYASPAQHRCSCGRTFINGIALVRHQWVTKHPGMTNKPHTLLPDPQAHVTQAAMAQAMRVLKQKQAEQQQFDHKRRQRRRLRRQLVGVQRSLEIGFASLIESAVRFGRSLLMAGRIVFLLGFIAASVAAGMKLGTFFPA